MNSETVEKYLRRVPVLFTGVYASDRLPTHVVPSSAIVVNTDPHTERGEHWVAIYRDGDSNVIEYFDSFGRPPFQAEYQQLLRRNAGCHYVYNKYCLQGHDTSVCGHYCLTYLYCRARYGLTLNDFVHAFDVSRGNTVDNDTFVLELFEALYLKGKRRREKDGPT